MEYWKQRVSSQKQGFTLVELLVVISIIALLLAILLPSLGKAREQGQKTVCMSNTRQLQLGWSVYAENNGGRLVFASTTRVKQGNGYHKPMSWILSDLHPEASWVGCPTSVEDDLADVLPVLDPKSSSYDPWYNDEIVKMGTLYSTIRDLKAYRCPATVPWTKNLSRNYAISSRMNGYNGAGEGELRKSIKFTNINSITNASEMMVFICQGGVFPDDYGYECYSPFAEYGPSSGTIERSWRDLPPPVHIGKTGTALSFADGHSNYWKWDRSKDYVKTLMDGVNDSSKRLNVQTEDKDFDRVYGAIWGKPRYK